MIELKIEDKNKQKELEDYMVKESHAYHFVSKCNWDYPDFKGVTHKIDTKKPYLFVKEKGKGDGDEHHHLYFFSDKSINTVKKYLKECRFINLKHSDPSNPKYNKYNDIKGHKDLLPYKNIGCLVYLSKGVTNHMKTDDDLNVKPNISIDNIEDITELRELYEEIIEDMREKRRVILEDKVDSTKLKTEKELFRWFEYIENVDYYHDLPEKIGDFFLENPDIIHSEHKGFSFYKSALKKNFPMEYRNFCRDCVLKKIKQLTEI